MADVRYYCSKCLVWFETNEHWFEHMDKKEEVKTEVEQAIKHDAGKPDLSMVSKELMEELARVREFGAKKYSRNNWRKGFKFTRSIAAALRHITAFNSGQDLDPESGLSHIGHGIACLEHLLNDYKNHPENDDRSEE